jgi:hypothetical protein
MDPSPAVPEALGPMNLLFQSLCSLFPPRLPRLGREDVAGTAEYYNRLARHSEAIDPPDMWMGRISTERAERIRPCKAAPRTSHWTLLARPASMAKDRLISKVLNWARWLRPLRQRSGRSLTNTTNAPIYGRKRAIPLSNKVAIPATGRRRVRVLQANSPRNESKQTASR